MKEDQVSYTAYLVLQGLLLRASQPSYQNLVPAETQAACRQILATSKQGQKCLSQLKNPLFRQLLPILERISVPGLFLHYAMRKNFIESTIHQAIAEGVTQVINLGAGFDTLAWRLHTHYPSINFIEIDHPATSVQKAKALLEHTPPNFHLLTVDFNENHVKHALERCPAFTKSRPSIFICEGVLMYLPESDVVRLFAEIKQLTGSGTRFIFSSLDLDSAGSNTSWLFKLYLRLKGEPLIWNLQRAKMASFLAQQEYTLIETAGTAEFRQHYLQSIPHGKLHQGEYLTLARAN